VVDRFSDGVVVDFEVFEKIVILGFRTEDVAVHAVHPLEGTIELTVMSAFVEVEYFLTIELWHFQVLIGLH